MILSLLLSKRLLYLLLGIVVGTVLSVTLGIGRHWLGGSHAHRTGQHAASSRSATAVASHDTGQCPIPGADAVFNPTPAMKSSLGNGPHEVRVAFASHPRSGSTWSRILIERMSGMPTAVERESWVRCSLLCAPPPPRPLPVRSLAPLPRFVFDDVHMYECPSPSSSRSCVPLVIE